MADYYTEMAATSPDIWWRMDEDPQVDSTMIDNEGVLDATYGANMTRVASPVAASAGAIRFPTTDTIQTANTTIFQSLFDVTVACWLRRPVGSTGFVQPFRTFGNGDYFRAAFRDASGGQLWFDIEENAGSNNYRLTINSALPSDDNWYFFVFRFEGGGTNTASVFRDGSLLDSGSTTAAGVDRMSAELDEFIDIHPLSHGLVDMDQLAIWQRALSDTEIADLWASRNTGATPQPQTAPLLLRAFAETAAQSAPLLLRSQAQAAAQSVPLLLRAPDTTHYTAAAMRWGVSVNLGGANISDDLLGQITITAEENASTICTVQFWAPEGALNLNSYENAGLAVDFLGKDAAGATTYSVRRFTGVTTTAVIDPDRRVLTVEATTDLQGKVEPLSREAIDALIGGFWSENIFDDTAQGWTYAQQVLETVPKSLFVDPSGALKVTAWTAGGGEVTFTDGERFNDTLRLERSRRRDLISRNVINIDFRFTRLRHREIYCRFNFTPGFCGYLNGEARIVQRSAITQATDSNGWTRTGSINFTPLPPTQGNICGGLNWVAPENAEDWCIGANWYAARRFAQTVTETYELTVIAEDIEAAVGQQGVEEDYGVEATYDAFDWENVTDFDGPAAGMTVSPKTDDYQLDADQVTEGGRADLAVAIECALNKAKTEILGRARGNRVSIGTVYDPTISLDSTISISTPNLSATGKLYSYTETLDLDRGAPSMTLDVALSRHGGSGLGVNDPTDTPPDPPEQEDEAPSSRTFIMRVYSGGGFNAPADNPEWSGWITNRYGAAIQDPTKLYEQRFAVNMPAIEAGARNESIVGAAETYGVAVPEDPLSLSF